MRNSYETYKASERHEREREREEKQQEKQKAWFRDNVFPFQIIETFGNLETDFSWLNFDIL